MRLCSIASGSSGNCIYVGSDNTHLLIDTGISKKRIDESLAELGLSGEDINGILITHEHSDHIQGLGVFSRKYEIPMLAASPISCMASEIMATLPVNIPPIISKIENAKFNINAIKIFFSVFIRVS